MATAASAIDQVMVLFIGSCFRISDPIFIRSILAACHIRCLRSIEPPDRGIERCGKGYPGEIGHQQPACEAVDPRKRPWWR